MGQIQSGNVRALAVTGAMPPQGAETAFLHSNIIGTFLAADATKWKCVAGYANISLD